MKEPVWLNENFVLALHQEMLAEFGGADGVRDEGLLHSALTRPQNLLAYESPSLFDLAASYAFGIIGNHPFIDGNKRTGFMAAYVFLGRNGWELTASEPDATATTLALASKAISQNDYSAWLKANCVKIK